MKKYIIPTVEQLDLFGCTALLQVSNPPQGNEPDPKGEGNLSPRRKVF